MLFISKKLLKIIKNETLREKKKNLPTRVAPIETKMTVPYEGDSITVTCLLFLRKTSISERIAIGFTVKYSPSMGVILIILPRFQSFFFQKIMKKKKRKKENHQLDDEICDSYLREEEEEVKEIMKKKRKERKTYS